MASEKAREREVLRYYQTWLESSAGFLETDCEPVAYPAHPNGFVPKPSGDKALIAFAQLGCLRLNAKRGVVSLISGDRQYVVAEATKTLSLISGLAEDNAHDDVWFGNASIPRSQGIAEYALDPPNYTAIDQNGQTQTAPALVIPDLLEDERFKDRALSGNGVNFYAGVPIVSPMGHAIGVYTVTDDKPRDRITIAELGFLLDMSKIVMRHFDIVKNDAARSRGDKMVLGLGAFLNGKNSVFEQIKTQRPLGVEFHIDQSLMPAATEERPERQFKGMTIVGADREILRSTANYDRGFRHGKPQDIEFASTTDELDRSEGLKQTEFSIRSDASEQVDSETQISSEFPQIQHASSANASQLSEHANKSAFARAANILLECAVADGVVFFDAANAHSTKRIRRSQTEPVPQDSSDNSSGTGKEGSFDSTSEVSSGVSTDSDGLQESHSRILNSKGPKCQILGHALDTSDPSTSNSDTLGTLGLTERSLRQFIRRYPRGKSFFFTEEGDASGSDRNTRLGERSKSSKSLKKGNTSQSGSTRWTSNSIAEELISIVPGARNVFWLPLWDVSKKRWSAGMFLWSRRSERLLMAQDDLRYLKTFGSAIMTEVLRIDAQSADEAKATFIANVSHELRSPLHGVLGSVEFMQDTAMDPFQSSMMLAIETCAKTLLDTVEHVLDYAKINQTSTRIAKRGVDKASNNLKDPLVPKLDRDLDLAALCEESVEAVFAGQTFRSSDDQGQFSPKLDEHSHESARTKILLASSKPPGSVSLILSFAQRNHWWFHSQPGAIRRVIMNLVGNSLKYTKKGTITISLASIEKVSPDSRDETICLTVKDTGIGMSTSFLNNYAFTPFSQESRFSSGIGLGLSIVRQVVHSLRGRIEFHSAKDIGTEAKVYLTLPALHDVSLLRDPSDIVSDVKRRVSEKTMCILRPRLNSNQSFSIAEPSKSIEASISDFAQTWYGMKIVKATSVHEILADFFVYAEPPTVDHLLKLHSHHSNGRDAPIIILTTNAFETASLVANGANHLTNMGRVVEVISQPFGPRKLAQALHRCLSRLNAREKTQSGVTHVETKTPTAHETALESRSEPTPENVTRIHFSQKDDSTRVKTDHERIRALQLQSIVDSGYDDTESVRNNELDKNDNSASPALATPTDQLRPYTDESQDPVSNRSLPRVLLVDDNDINLKLLVAFVSRAGYAYSKATNGSEAVEAYEKASASPETAFKFVFMDVNMPVMDGTTATRLIRNWETKQGVKEAATIIVLTGLATNDVRKQMFDAGADFYLTKPIKFKDLTQLIGTAQLT